MRNICAAGADFIGSLAAVSWLKPAPVLIWNDTTKHPSRSYRWTGNSVGVGDIVAFNPGAPVSRRCGHRDRSYLGLDRDRKFKSLMQLRLNDSASAMANKINLVTAFANEICGDSNILEQPHKQGLKMTSMKYLVASSVLAIAVAAPATAQEGGTDRVLDEIYVTAQKKPETAQSVPIAINAYSGDFIDDAGINDIGDLVAYTPGLAGDNYQDTESVFTIRGIGTSAFGVGADTSVGVFVDDVYQGRTVNAGNSFFDVERVEVVKGPQGTLFGRNTAAGAISIITKKPDLGENYAEAQVGFGDENQQSFQGVLNGSLADDTAVRLAVNYDKRDGTFKNTTDGQELNNRDHFSARVSLISDWSDTAHLTLTGEYFSADSHSGAIALAGTPAADIALISDEVTQNVSSSQDIQSLKLMMNNEFELSDQLTFTSITGYLDTELLSVPVDVDTTDQAVLYLSEPQDITQFSQEFRFVGTHEGVDWLLGASATLEDIQGITTYNFDDDAILTALAGADCATLGVPPGSCNADAQEEGFAKSENTSYGLYGNAKFALSDLTTLTIGGRYSYDEKDFTHNADPTDSATTALVLGGNLFKPVTGGPIMETMSWDQFTYRVSLDHQATDDVLLYASYSTGYKAGGFNSIGDFTDPANPTLPTFDPEENDAIEAGIKARVFDGRGRINAAVFMNDYTNFQVETTTDGLQIFIQNAAEAETKGFEIDGQVILSDNFEVFGSYAYLDTEFKSGQAFNGLAGTLDDLSGNVLPRAPETTFNLGGVAMWPVQDLGEFSVRGSYSHIGDQFFDPFQSVALSENSYELIDVRAALESEDGTWALAIVGENLSDERYFGTKAVGLGPIGIPNIGRLVRGELSVRFN